MWCNSLKVDSFTPLGADTLFCSILKTYLLLLNGLQGKIPPEIGGLNDPSIDLLLRLNLYGNALYGTIPFDRLGDNLVKLVLVANQLEGSIPASIGYLNQLAGIYMESNKIAGSLPLEMGNLSMLTDLRLRDNLMTGSLPSSLFALTALKYVGLRHNSISGPRLRDCYDLFWNNTNLLFLDLFNNSFTGTISTLVGELTSLLQVFFGANSFSGTIPTQIGLLANLVSLGLEQNQLEGSIPTELLQLTRIGEETRTPSLHELFSPSVLPWFPFRFHMRN
jgi:Leucine-rich repeat (LRR) protein